jgi:DNA-binding MurR/RpiR family transcriptional regulator
MSQARTESAITLINRHYSSLSTGHRRVADFLLSSPHEAALMTVEALAASSGVSAATANRFAGKIGLANHPHLKRLLKEELQQALRPVEELGALVRVSGLSPETPWTRSLEADMSQIGSIHALGGDHAFSRGGNMIAEARRVFLIGFGGSAFIASYGAFNLASLRDGVEAVTDASGIEGVQRRLLGASAEDVAVIFAFARYSTAIFDVGSQLARRGVPQIAVTDGQNSLFAEAAVTICLDRKTGFVLSGGGAGALAVMDALLHSTAAIIGPESVEARFARLTTALSDAIVNPKYKDAAASAGS